MKAQILKKRKKFRLSCGYKTRILKVIRKIKKRYYNTKSQFMPLHQANKIWRLPLEEYQDFSYVLLTDPEFEFEVKELKAVDFTKPIVDKISVKLSQFIEQFKKYMKFAGRCYNQLERNITMHYSVEALSKELGFEVSTEGIVVV